MDRLHSDLIMQVLAFVNVVDALQSLQFTSKRIYYLIYNYQAIAAPQLAAASSPQECLRQLSRKPNFVLTFSESSNDDGGDGNIPTCIPPEAIVLGALAANVQSNLNGEVMTEPGVMMASFGQTEIQPFLFLGRPDSSSALFRLQQVDVVIVYACGDVARVAEWFVTSMQIRFPNATIVGGLCEGGYVSVGNGDIRHIRNGIFGIVGTNFPVKSIVSRGVNPLLNEPYTVQTAQLIRPDNEEYIFMGLDVPYHRITRLKSPEGNIVSPLSILARHQPDFCGICRPGEDGFELNALSPISLQTNSIIIITDGYPEQEASLENAALNLYSLSGEACNMHMDWTLGQLKKQTRDEVILGAIMFSCSGRGPQPGGLIRERMADAARFHKHFPLTPCLGFYAGGEIGPMALAGHENVFQRGKVAVQGFTAVFAVFIVPLVEPPTFDLDDCKENVAEFVKSRLGRRAEDALEPEA